MSGLHRVAVAWGGLALAVASSTGAQQVRSDSTEHVQRPPAPPFAVDGSRIAGDSLHYAVYVATDSSTQRVGTHVVRIAEGTFAGRPAWTVTEHRASAAPFVERVAVDTVLLGRDALVPLRWEGLSAGARFVAAFANDSVYGATSAGDARRSYRAPASGQAVTTEGALDLMLRASPLAPGWAADASLIVAELDTIRLVPLQAWVEREAQLDLGAGVHEVWVVRMQAGGAERMLWVDKGTQRVLRAATRAPYMPGMVYERVLVEPQ